MTKKYEKIFTREFTLPWLQIWYQGEAKTPKPWNNQLNHSFPYIVFVQHDDTVTSYYDTEGLNWSRGSVLAEVKKDAAFIQKIESKVIASLKKINTYLDIKVISNDKELLSFLDFFQQAYSWLLAMWEIGESDPDQIAGLKVDPVLRLKKTTVTLTDDIDNLIRKSLGALYPDLSELAHFLSIEEIRSGKLPSHQELTRRAGGFIFTDNNLFAPEKLETVEAKYGIKLNITKVDKNISTLRGSTASLGYAKGVVRKVMSAKHLNDFQEGEI